MKMLQVILFILYGVLLGVFGVAVWRLRYADRHFKVKSTADLPRDVTKLPSVTVCIPARNETHAMSDSLQRVIASTYPKLEVIVLDDMSGDNTSSLIKAFAHDGVRFVEGSKLPKGWLGKNHALQGLLNEASGKYILFMDVDTRLAPDSIDQLVAYAQREKALMVSVLPRREDTPRASVFLAPLRYFWEVMFHSRTSPATASNAWLIDRQTLLHRFQGFEPYKDAIQPESRLSAALMATSEYRFIFGNEALGVSYEKKWRSQTSTSIRLLFPLLHHKVSHTLVAIADLLIVSSPVFIVAAGFIFGWGLHQLIAGIFMLFFAALYATYLKRIWNKDWIIGGVLWTVIVIQEIVLIIMSCIQYRRKLVTWKGRSVSSLE